MKYTILHEQDWDYDSISDEQITLLGMPDDFEMNIPMLKEFFDSLEGFTYRTEKDMLLVKHPSFPKSWKHERGFYPTTLLETIRVADVALRAKFIAWLETRGVFILPYDYIFS